MITLYHRTTTERAEAILRDGFRDGSANYSAGDIPNGVWLSNRPLDCVDISYLGDALLRVTLNRSEEALDQYEWKSESIRMPGEGWGPDEEGKGYREWLIPAQVINANSKIELLDDAAEAAIFDEMWAKKAAKKAKKGSSK
jgi:hypothetical protein